MENSASKLEKSELLKPVNLENEQSSSLLLREATVLSGGLSAGGKAGIIRSAESLQNFGSELASSPGGTLTKFVSNHWKEAGIAAAVAALTPRGMAATIIGALSFKDLAASTYDAMKMAADPNKSLKETRESYAGQVAGQTEALISGLPMTLAGASLGRASANIAFGKNMSALDLVTGKLSPGDLKSNLLNAYEQVRRPEVKLVVTDMDNTLLSTHKQQALGLEQSVKDLSKKTGINEKELYSSLGKVMEEVHSHSYPWTLELALKDRLKLGQPGGMPVEKFNREIADPFWKTMDRSMEHLEVYSGVRAGLEEIGRRNIAVVVLSDASASSGIRRFTYLNLDRAPIERIYTLRNPAEPAGLPEELLLAGRKRLADALATPHGLKEFSVLPREWEKPSAGGMKAIMELYNLRPSQVLMIGDSLKRDMGVAANTGARGLFAKYNEAHPEYDAILNRFRQAGEKPNHREKLSKPVPFEAPINSFAEVPGYLKPGLDLSAVPRIGKQNFEWLLTPPLVIQDRDSEPKT